uniref:Putative secreted protein n=1 Tax=Ixodes ricinus TaxID=34613 RepID=A0A6B0U931_IXORI
MLLPLIKLSLCTAVPSMVLPVCICKRAHYSGKGNGIKFGKKQMQHQTGWWQCTAVCNFLFNPICSTHTPSNVVNLLRLIHPPPFLPV